MFQGLRDFPSLLPRDWSPEMPALGGSDGKHLPVLGSPQKASGVGWGPGIPSEFRPKKSLSKSEKSLLPPTRASSDTASGAGLRHQGLSAALWSGPALTINSFPQKVRLKQIPEQDVIRQGQASSSDREGDKGKREKAPGEREAGRWSGQALGPGRG